jgi:hypothetical protein
MERDTLPALSQSGGPLLYQELSNFDNVGGKTATHTL